MTPTTSPDSVVSSSAEALASVFSIDSLLSSDEREWQQKARAFAQERIMPVIEDDFENKHFRRELIAELGATGFLGMHITGYGCAGASAVSYGAVCLELEAADSGWRTFVSVQGSLAMSAIAKFGSEQQKNELLPRMAKGELVGCFALTEPDGGSDPAGMHTTAVRDGDDWIISGTKRWIGLASVADIAIVWAQTDDGVRGFIVPTSSEGFTATPIDGKLAMRASIQCDVELDSVRVPEAMRLPNALGLRGPFSCLNEARYGIIWGVWALPAAASRPRSAARSSARYSAGRSVGSS